MRALLDFFSAHPKVGIVGPKILDEDGGLQYSCRSFPSYFTFLANRYSLLTRLFPGNPWSRKYLKSDVSHLAPFRVDWVSGAALFHRRSLLSSLKSLDEKYFMYCEDVDFCFRALRAGFETFFNPALTIVHRIGGSSVTASSRMVVERHKSIWHYYTKHFQRNGIKDIFVFSLVCSRALMLYLLTFFRRKRHD